MQLKFWKISAIKCVQLEWTMRRKFYSHFSVSIFCSIVCGCNVSTPGANGTLYGGYDLDNAVRGMYQEKYRKNPQSALLDLKSANKTAARKIAVSKHTHKKKRKKTHNRD